MDTMTNQHYQSRLAEYRKAYISAGNNRIQLTIIKTSAEAFKQTYGHSSCGYRNVNPLVLAVNGLEEECPECKNATIFCMLAGCNRKHCNKMGQDPLYGFCSPEHKQQWADITYPKKNDYTISEIQQKLKEKAKTAPKRLPKRPTN